MQPEFTRGDVERAAMLAADGQAMQTAGGQDMWMALRAAVNWSQLLAHMARFPDTSPAVARRLAGVPDGDPSLSAEQDRIVAWAFAVFCDVYRVLDERLRTHQIDVGRARRDAAVAVQPPLRKRVLERAPAFGTRRLGERHARLCEPAAAFDPFEAGDLPPAAPTKTDKATKKAKK